jgi:hypothetical protein
MLIGVLYLTSCSDDTLGLEDFIVATSTVNAGHSHTAEMPEDDVVLTEAETYESSTASGHTHMVTLTPGDFTTLRTDAVVVVESSIEAGHSHEFTFDTR